MIYCDREAFSGFAIIYDPEKSVIEIKDKFGKEIISYTKTTSKRFRKVLRKISKGICPVCKKSADVGWIAESKLASPTSVHLYHSATGNYCPGDMVVRNVWADYAYEPAGVWIWNMDETDKCFQKNFTRDTTPRSQKAIMLYGKCRISPAAKTTSK